MKRKLIASGAWFILAALVAACGPLATNPTPYPTYTPYPEPTPRPTYTPYPTPEPQAPDITNLFCEYDFCIGHPTGLYLRDSAEETDPQNAYGHGVLMGVDYNSYMLLGWWQATEAEWDSSFQIRDKLSDDEFLTGDLIEQTIGDMTVTHAEIQVVDPDLPLYGAVAAWFCEDRGFLGKIYIRQENLALPLLRASLKRFTCAE